MQYEDLELRFWPDGDGFRVVGQRGEEVASERLELGEISAWHLWSPREKSANEAVEIGVKLFSTVIRGGIRDLYQVARGRGRGDTARGSRIRIHLDPTDRRLHPLFGLPWEAMVDPTEGAGVILSLDRRRPIVRTISSAAETLSPTTGGLDRVLIAIADPRMPDRLDLEGECAAIEGALGVGGIKPVVRRQLTRRLLFESLRGEDFSVVHWMGHGKVDDATGEGCLLVEGDRGEPDPVLAPTFSGLFAGRAAPRLVVLAACHTGSSIRGLGGPLSGVAASLVALGLPAVLAMQAAIRDRGSRLFSEILYRELSRGTPIEPAVVEARVAMRTLMPSTLDWAIPTLFVRGRSEVAFGRQQEPSPLVERGVELFGHGQLGSAAKLFRQALEADPHDLRALLFKEICRLALATDQSSDVLLDIDRALQKCTTAVEPKTANVAQWALAIHRLDRVEPRRLRVQGMATMALVTEVRRRSRSELEDLVARSLRPSRDARRLLGLS